MSSAKTTLLAFCLVGMLGGATLHLQACTQRAYHQIVSADERYYLPPPNWLRVFSLGYTEATADLIWMKAVIAFGAQFQQGDNGEGARFTFNYLGTAAALDPQFRRLYTDGSSLTMFQNQGQISKKSVKMAIELLEKGASAFPNDGQILFTLGFMHYYELRPFLSKDPKNPERIQSAQLGARLIGRASLLPDAPKYASLLSASLLSKAGMNDLVLAHLQAMLDRETDPTLRASLKQRLMTEFGMAYQRDMETTETLMEKWRVRFPYIPYDLFLALGEDLSLEELRNPLVTSNRILGIDETPDEPTSPSPSETK